MTNDKQPKKTPTKRAAKTKKTTSAAPPCEMTPDASAALDSERMCEMPRDPDALWEWVRDVLGVEVARVPLLPGHASPMDYLWHAFDETPRESVPSDCVVWANRGGGKTFMGALATALDMIFKPGIEIRILAGSMDQGRRMHAHLRRFFGVDALHGLVSGKMTERRIRLRNGSEVELLAQSQASIRGTRVQKLRCDEVELFHPDVWEAAQLTTRSRQCGDVLVRGSIECLSTMHVPFGVMHRLVGEAAQGKRRMFKWGVLDVLGACETQRRCELTHEDGTTTHCGLLEECRGRAKERPGNNTGRVGGHLRIDDALRMKGRVALETWKTEMLCERPRRKECVVEEFNAGEHVFEDSTIDTNACTWIGGMDFGFNAPTVVLWACVDDQGVVRVMDERCVTERTVKQHADAIVAEGRPTLAWLGIDPAGNARNDQTACSDRSVLEKAGITVRARRMNVEPGLDLVRARFKPAGGGPRLFVHKRCVKLIESLETYRYDPLKPESATPMKDGSDHAVDALRYMIVNLDRPPKTQVREY